MSANVSTEVMSGDGCSCISCSAGSTEILDDCEFCCCKTRNLELTYEQMRLSNILNKSKADGA